MSVEIRASDSYYVVKGHEMLMEEMKKPLDVRLTEY
jgi:hypothetical protein